MEILTEIAFKIIVETVLISGILGFIFMQREERMKKTIEEEFKKRDKFYDTQFNFKLRSLEELLAPVSLQLMRSKIAVQRYDEHNIFREQILKECNETIRRLLLEKGHLIPLDLIPHAQAFIIHYDNWMQLYIETRGESYDKSVAHVFTHDFPKKAETAFVEKHDAYRKELKIEDSLN